MDGEIARRIRCANHAVAPTKRTPVVPQPPVAGFNVGAINDPESATMASALIFLHVGFLAIDRVTLRSPQPVRHTHQTVLS